MPSRYQTSDSLLGFITDSYSGNRTPVSKQTSGNNSALVLGEGGHYGYPQFPDDRDVGGPFDLRFSRYVNIPSDVGEIQAYGPYHNLTYTGKWIGTVPWFNPPTTAPTGSAFGASAYAKMKPDRPNMQLLNAIYELKDVPDMLRQRFLKHGLSEIGNYYLALKFGWEPLLRDVVSFVNTHRNAQKRLDQLIRDEGKPVRRRIQLSSTAGNLLELSGPGAYDGMGFNSYFYSGNTRYTYRELPTTTAWASAQFRYWLPPGPRDVAWRRWMLARIYGLKPTPRVVYNAIPWSWLIDWFSNLGDVISNLDTSLVDRLAADYFYVMQRNMTTASRVSTIGLYRKGTLEPFTVTCTSASFIGSLTRVKGDPFGFATAQNSLSGVQLSILGALGLSRLR